MLSFLPDADPAIPEVLTGVYNCLPTLRGYIGSPSPVSAGVAATGSDAFYISSNITLDGAVRTIAGTATDLYELTGTTWTSRRTAYNATREIGWSICQFGNATVAANGADIIQHSVYGVSSNFTDISGAPSAAIVTTVSPGFVMAFDTDDGVDELHDGWWCSALRDHTDWTPSASTQSANGRLVDSPGSINAGLAIGDGVAAYKQRSIYYGQYVGGDVIWSWSRVAGNAGCVGKHAVVDAGGVHYFVGVDNIWMYDGAQPVAIADGIKEWFYRTVDKARMHLIQARYDRERSHIWFFCPSADSAAFGFAIVYHITTKRWGYVSVPCTAALAYQQAGITMDTLPGTFAAQPDIPFDSPYWQGGAGTMLAIMAGTDLQTLSGTTGTSIITSGDYGDDDRYTTLRRCRVHWTQEPQITDIQNFYKSGSGIAWAAGIAASVSDQKADFLQSARWHRLQLIMFGDHETTAIKPELVPNGTR